MSTYRVIRLLKNHLYPTYQFHGFMANQKTPPKDGLRLAALTTLEWLCHRLGENTPEELQHLPSPDQYREVSDACLTSLHLNAGFMIDIVSLPLQGIWTLQITEPDLGPDPGNAAQERQPVAGRIIETNVAYQVVENRLECGFQTVISDPEDTKEAAETYRLAIVRRLANHPDFGLFQVNTLTENCVTLSTLSQLKTALSIADSSENDLPVVLFTQVLKQSEEAAKLDKLCALDLDALAVPYPAPERGVPLHILQTDGVKKPAAAPLQTPKAVQPPYDIQKFAKYGISLCRTYLLEHPLLDKLMQLKKCKAAPGDIILLEPTAFGGACTVLPYSVRKSEQDAVMEKLKQKLYQYPRGREIDFGQISFLSAAKEALLDDTESMRKEADTLSDRWAEKLELLRLEWEEQLKKKEQTCGELKEQISSQRQKCAKAEQEKAALRQAMEDQEVQQAAALQKKDELIAALRRRLNQPTEHTQVAAWVKKEFGERLLLHEKAIALLNDKSARTVDISLICDALDFLATDYWDRRYAGISEEEMNSRCAEKYDRPFDVSRTGTTSIEYTPSEYKIKYFIGKKGKPVESSLDYHLRVGNRAETLLRIYFLHDDAQKRIVVGSLPCHLRAVSIK